MWSGLNRKTVSKGANVAIENGEKKMANKFKLEHEWEPNSNGEHEQACE